MPICTTFKFESREYWAFLSASFSCIFCKQFNSISMLFYGKDFQILKVAVRVYRILTQDFNILEGKGVKSAGVTFYSTLQTVAKPIKTRFEEANRL